MMSEINRILKPGGHLVLTTPNIVSPARISAILQGYHPGFFPAYIGRPSRAPKWMRGTLASTRRARSTISSETPASKHAALETGEFLDEPHPEHGWVQHLLELYGLTQEFRGDGIYAVGVKRGPVRDRFPAWLYN